MYKNNNNTFECILRETLSGPEISAEKRLHDSRRRVSNYYYSRLLSDQIIDPRYTLNIHTHTHTHTHVAEVPT